MMTTAMLPADHAHPYPDYVTCPHCGEPEVEVWCNVTTATCHACGREFDHALPAECGPVCSLIQPGDPKPENAQDETTLT
jgi:transcription elongation factor Elf1